MFLIIAKIYSTLVHSQPIFKILRKFTHNFWSYPDNKQATPDTIRSGRNILEVVNISKNKRDRATVTSKRELEVTVTGLSFCRERRYGVGLITGNDRNGHRRGLSFCRHRGREGG